VKERQNVNDHARWLLSLRGNGLHPTPLAVVPGFIMKLKEIISNWLNRVKVDLDKIEKKHKEQIKKKDKEIEQKDQLIKKLSDTIEHFNNPTGFKDLDPIEEHLWDMQDNAKRKN